MMRCREWLARRCKGCMHGQAEHDGRDGCRVPCRSSVGERATCDEVGLLVVFGATHDDWAGLPGVQGPPGDMEGALCVEEEQEG